MGCPMISLAFFLPESRQRVLSLLLLHPQMQYHVREIARLTNTSAGSLHRDLVKLAQAQVLLREVSGHQVYYQANIAFPIFNELVSIFKKSSGIVDVLKNALSPHSKQIEAAFIFGSMASGKENINSDVDVLIIGDISFADAVKVLYSSQNMINREINPKVYKRSEWRQLMKTKNAFVKEVLKKPKIFLVGQEDDLK